MQSSNDKNALNPTDGVDTRPSSTFISTSTPNVDHTNVSPKSNSNHSVPLKTTIKIKSDTNNKYNVQNDVTNKINNRGIKRQHQQIGKTNLNFKEVNCKSPLQQLTPNLS